MLTEVSDSSTTRPLHRRVLVFAALLVALATSLLAPGPARADVNDHDIGHVWLNLGSPGSSAQNNYAAFVNSLRQAAGHEYRNGVWQTQSQPTSRLIRIDLTSPDGRTVWLWVTPHDLYLRGFTSQANGTTYFFNDFTDFPNLFQALSGHLLLPPNHSLSQLSFGSNYNAMRQAAGRGRESMPIGWNDLTASIDNLASTGYPYGAAQQNVARSLMFMIQFTSEAARFWDVYGVTRDIQGGNRPVYQGLPERQQYLENSWDQISRYAYDVSNNPNTPPVNVTGVGMFYSFGDVQRWMAMLIGVTSQVSSTGDWNHAEL
ncbi:ribosome-inactivating family protein [Kitasatospora sp. NPDC002551]|uniref:ribosome-inactivating family protein n=1 Tax=Kitasatospora sp. NPDC002551 TaxID=3154539 RepID=UPI0033188045